MIKSAIKFFKEMYRNVLRSIAFYPVLISIGFFIMAIVVIQVEKLEWLRSLKNSMPYLFIQDIGTARATLTTLIGGILSLTVFSFTMVMVVLNQASTNFSPRLLPGLISDRRHQIILGIYIGTLLYCIIVLISLGATVNEVPATGFSSMLAAFLGIVCLGLFVYFIHSISTSIQIDNIMESIYSSSRRNLGRELEENEKGSKIALHTIQSKDFKIITSRRTGYFKDFDRLLLKKSLKEEDNQIEVIPYLGQSIWKGDPLLRIKNPISDEELDGLLFCIDLSDDRHEGKTGVNGLIKLMEIAVKAMSPGINDPGTALEAITKIGPLLSIALRFPNTTSEILENGKLIIIRNNITATELMRIVVQPLRQYGKKDLTILQRLIGMLQFLERDTAISSDKRKIVAQEIDSLKCDIEISFTNSTDKKKILEAITGEEQ